MPDLPKGHPAEGVGLELPIRSVAGLAAAAGGRHRSSQGGHSQTRAPRRPTPADALDARAAISPRGSALDGDGDGDDAVDWDPDEHESAAPDSPETPDPNHPVRRPTRRSGAIRFRRLTRRWVPEALPQVRVDPGRRGAIALVLVAVLAAATAAWALWRADSGTPTSVQPMSVLTTVAQSGSVASSSADVATPSMSNAAGSAAPVTEPTTIVVSVTGAVRQPGIVTLPSGSRVSDAVTAAGGMIDGTDFTGLNLAAKVSDGDSVVIGGGAQGVQRAPGGGVPSPAGSSSTATVNLNTADQATLETLPGVGPVMASNILAWRTTNGSFTSIDQLREITGIGPARFATLSPLVSL